MGELRCSHRQSGGQTPSSPWTGPPRRPSGTRPWRQQPPQCPSRARGPRRQTREPRAWPQPP